MPDMRNPDFELDGWCLDDGEARHRETPGTFWIPKLEDRKRLQPGDLAKLIFRISVDNQSEPVSVERMWVVVRERTPDGYLGILDNDPDAIDENEELWHGTEVPFRTEHVIDIDTQNENTVALANSEPRRRWRPD